MVDSIVHVERAAEDSLDKDMANLVLASASPRRRELLTQAGYAFTVRPAHIPEDPRPGEYPIAYVVRLAREKAVAVYREIGRGVGSSLENAGPSTPAARAACARDDSMSGGVGSDLVVLGADTTVTIDGQILGKPEGPEDAARMLRMLSGRTHRVITGIAVVREGSAEVAAEVTAVRFLSLSDEEIAGYVATGEPMDKAGAYAIQGRAAKWIPRIEGCYFNVVGLPLALVAAMLESVRKTAS
jgi:septum formation protein